MKKRILTVILAVIMVLGLASCSSKPYNYDLSEYVTIGEIKGLTYSKKAIDESVETTINSYLNEKATSSEVTDRAVQDGDTVNIDFTGYMNNEEFEGGSGKDTSLTIGSNSMIPGFETGLIDHNIGETVTLNLTFPEEYEKNTSLAGKDVTFEVKINSISVLNVPELTDELVKADGEYETAEEYKEAIRENAVKNVLWNSVYSSAKVLKYPEKEIGKLYQTMLTNYKTMAANNGIAFETFATYYGYENAEELCNSLASYATTQAVQEMILWSIVRTENIQLSNDEYKSFAEQYAKDMSVASVKELEATYSKVYIEQSAYMEKVLEFITENAIEAE